VATEGRTRVRVKCPHRFNEVVGGDCNRGKHNICISLGYLDSQSRIVTFEIADTKDLLQAMLTKECIECADELLLSAEVGGYMAILIRQEFEFVGAKGAFCIEEIATRHNMAVVLGKYVGGSFLSMPSRGSVMIVNEALSGLDVEVTMKEGYSIAVLDFSVEKKLPDGSVQVLACLLGGEGRLCLPQGWEF
jgi:hypothetical protein